MVVLCIRHYDFVRVRNRVACGDCEVAYANEAPRAPS